MSVTFSKLGSLGRIGNQLFQVASTIGIAKNRCQNAVFPEWPLAKYLKNPIDQSLTNPCNYIDYHEPNFHYTDVVFQLNQNLIGYFQSEKYFKHCEEAIRQQFEPADDILAKLRSKYGTLLDRNTCSIHVRRGDYVNHYVHEVCGMDYYNSAIEYMKPKVDVFLVFSDDIGWCKEIFKGNFIFVEGNEDMEDLFLMSMCKHNIITNSSFSWWGSWLNKNPGKIVIAPEKWFADGGRDIKDLIPDTWIKIPVVKNEPPKVSVGLLVIATGKYDMFIQPLFDSARQYFCKNQKVTFFLFTDSKKYFGPDVVKIPAMHVPFPLPTLLRYNKFVAHADVLQNMDYLFYCDADMLFVGDVGDEILSDLVCTNHPGYGGTRGTPEERPESTAYVSKDTQMTYFCGGFNGGRRDSFLRMAAAIDKNTQIDYKNGLIAIWHDESHLNRYLIDNKPTKVLDSGYCYGEDMELPYKKRLVALTKSDALFEDKKVPNVIQDNPTPFLIIPERKIKTAVVFYHKNADSLYPHEWIMDCINSIRGQTFQDFDVFELNYGGDGKHYASGTGRHHYFINKKLGNHIDAMNTLLTYIFKQGYDVVWNTNMDDYYSPERFEKQLQEINQGYQVVSSNFIHIKENRDVIRYMDMVSLGSIEKHILNNHNIIAHPAVCMHRSFWDDDLHYHNLLGYEDLELWQRGIHKGKKFKILGDYLLYYRIHPQQIGAINSPSRK